MRLGVLLVPVVGVGLILLQSWEAFLGPGNLWRDISILQEQAERAAAMDRRLQVILTRFDIEWNLVKDLAAGDISFPEAIARIKRLRNHAEAACLRESLAIRVAGVSHEERFCRCVLQQVEVVLERSACPDSQKREVLARLDEEMTSFLRQGALPPD